MDLDELKQRWEEHDRKLDTVIRLNTELARESMLGKADLDMKRLVRWQVVALVVYLAASWCFAGFLARHIGEPRFAIPGAALLICTIALIITSGRQLASILQIQLAGPIVTVQRQLESLRIERSRATKWASILTPVLLVPLFIVLMQGLFQVDVYAKFNTAWLISNLVVCILVSLFEVWASRRYVDRVEKFTALHELLRDIAGHNMLVATGFLEQVSRFEENSDQE